MPTGSWDDGTSGATGVFDYKAVKAKVASGELTRYFDNDVKAPWAFSATSGVMISYDDPESIAAKCALVNQMGLGGVMTWDLTGDDNNELTNAIVSNLASGTMPTNPTPTNPVPSPSPTTVPNLPNAGKCPVYGAACDPRKEYSRCSADGKAVGKCTFGRVKFWRMETCPSGQICKVSRRGRARCVALNGSGTRTTCTA